MFLYKNQTNFLKICLLFIFCLFFFTACIDPDIPISDNKTYIKFINPTGYAVNVYVNNRPVTYLPPFGDVSIPAGGEKQFEISPSAEGINGDTFYFEYLIPVGSITIPFHEYNNTNNVRVFKVEKEIVNILNIPDLVSTSTN